VAHRLDASPLRVALAWAAATLAEHATDSRNIVDAHLEENISASELLIAPELLGSWTVWRSGCVSNARFWRVPARSEGTGSIPGLQALSLLLVSTTPTRSRP
jgi:hypothetical protein